MDIYCWNNISWPSYKPAWNSKHETPAPSKINAHHQCINITVTHSKHTTQTYKLAPNYVGVLKLQKGDPETTWHDGSWLEALYYSMLGDTSETSVGWELISHWEKDMSVKLLWASIAWIPLSYIRDLLKTSPHQIPWISSSPINHHRWGPITGLTPQHQLNHRTIQRGSSCLTTQTHDKGFLHRHKDLHTASCA